MNKVAFVKGYIKRAQEAGQLKEAFLAPLLQIGAGLGSSIIGHNLGRRFIPAMAANALKKPIKNKMLSNTLNWAKDDVNASMLGSMALPLATQPLADAAINKIVPPQPNEQGSIS